MNDRQSPLETAVALEYDGQTAPKVTALGQDELAEQIVKLAKEHDVPLYENPELAKLLSQLEIGQDIPESLYLAVAHVIAFVYFLQGKTPDGYEPPASNTLPLEIPPSDPHF